MFAFLARVCVVVAVIAAAVALVLWVEVTRTFESRLWTDPSTILSAPMMLEPGVAATVDVIVARLDRSGYARIGGSADRPGPYVRGADRIEVHLREAEAPGVSVPARRRTFRFRGDVLVEIVDHDGARRAAEVLEPEVLARLYGPRQEDRRPLAFAEIPEGFVHAVLAAEDARYFDHAGVDLRAIARAMVANLRSGEIVQVGSTVPQQTVKNLYLGHERTLWRKLREIPMALILDLRYSKERILEVYLNEVYLGQRGPVAVCGAESAARFYFGRTLRDLQNGEWAMLAGMIRSPGRYNPFAHPDRARARRDQVLDAEVRLGWMTSEDADRARSEPLRLASGESGYSRARYVADLVRADLRRLYSPEILEREGLEVHTTLDTHLQELAEDALRRGLERLERDRTSLRREAGQPRLQGAVVVTDPATGSILAMVGGRDYVETQFNRAVTARRQPGSCFKPFVFLAGFESGAFTPGSRIEDAPIEIESGGETWRPANYDGKFRGIVTAREALRDSLNVPTVRAARHVGLERVIEVANACGIESHLEPYPSLALGAQEVTPIELAGAYGTLANGGIRARPRILQEIRDHEGRRLERRDPELRRVVDRAATFLVNQVLVDVLDDGTARSARALGWDSKSAGKTGTTDDTRDAWFVGYTPRILALVWVGFDDNSRTGLTGASGALPIWVDLIRRAPAERTRAEFRRVPGVELVRIDPETGKRAVSGCPTSVGEWFAEGEAPEESCELHGGRVRRWFRSLFRDREHEDDPI